MTQDSGNTSARDGVSIYALIDPRDGAVRYIGKTNNPKRRLAQHIRDAQRSRARVHIWLQGLLAAGHRPRMDILEVCAAHAWMEAERRQVETGWASGAPLLNMAPGGLGEYTYPEVRAEVGRKIVATRAPTELKRRIWYLKRAIGQHMKEGRITEPLKAKLRYAAAKAPHLFGEYARL